MSSNLKAANAAKMRRMISRKSHSWWWDSHISPKNSKWLAENLEEMDRCVKEMLKLIEEEGDSFAKKAEMYYQKRPELISHVEDFYRMYRSLAERYDHVTGELRKNVQTELNSQGSGSGSDFGSEPPSPSIPTFDHIPESKPSIPKPGNRAAGFDFFLGSGGSSDKSRKGSDDSSSSSESDSDSDDTKEMNGDVLNQRIVELENELCVVKDKLTEHEKCGELANNNADLRLKVLALENDLMVANERLQVSEAEITSLHAKLRERNSMTVELGDENVTISKLEARVIELEREATVYRCEIEDLKGMVSAGNQEIEQYKAQLADASEKFSQEKSHLESDITRLEAVIKELKEHIDRISHEKFQLETTNLEQQHLITELKAAATNYEDILQEKSKLQSDIAGLEGFVKELKEEIDRISHEKMQLETHILQQQHLVDDLKAAAASSENFLQERSHLEADIVKLEGLVKELKGDIEKISHEKLLLETHTSQQQQLIEELKAAAEVSAEKFSQERSSLKAEISSLLQSNALLEVKLKQLESKEDEECAEKDGQISELSLSLEALKQQVAMLLAEKDELLLRASALNEDIRCRDERVHRMDEHLHQLHLEHVKLRKEIDEARRVGTELRGRVKELEDEVERQRVAISDGAERKREAIRQLCFSLEHYRDGYHHLRQMLQGHSKRPPTVMAI